MANYKTGHKSTQAEVELRIQEVIKLILSGLSRSAIIRYIAEKTTWDITDRTVDDYLIKARDRIAENGVIERRFELGKALHRLESLYAMNLKINDFKAALATQKEINALLALYEPHRIDVTSDNKAINFPVITVKWDNDVRDNPT